MAFVVALNEEVFPAVSLQLDQLKSIMPDNNGMEEFSRRVLTIAERYPNKQSELTAIVTRVAKAFTNIPEEQSEHQSEENVDTAHSHSEQAKLLLEAGELLDRLMAETPDKASPARSALPEEKLRDEMEMKKSTTLIQTEMSNTEVAVSIHETDTSHSPDIHHPVQLVSVTSPKRAASSTGNARVWAEFDNPQLRRPILPFLIMSYSFARRALQNARSVHIFYMQSIHIARQALKLVFRLNEAVDDDGPNYDQRAERIRLENELIDLMDSVKKWGAEDLAMEERDERLEEIRKQYDIFFCPRFYSQQTPNYKFLSMLVAYDDRTMERDQQDKSQTIQTSSTSMPLRELLTEQPAKEDFELLVNILTSLRNKGNLRPCRSTLKAELTPERIYGRAGVIGFKEYVSYAERIGLVRLGGDSDNPGEGWIELVATD